MMGKQIVSGFIIDEMRTPDPSLLQIAKKMNSHSAFANVLATKIRPQIEGIVNIISKHKICKERPKFVSMAEKIENSYILLTAIGMMHEESCTIGQQQLRNIIGYSGNELKVFGYRFQLINADQDVQAVKNTERTLQNVVRFGISCFLSQKKGQQTDRVRRDIWKWAYFTAEQMLQFAKPTLQEVFNKLLSPNNIKKQDFDAALAKNITLFQALPHLDSPLIQQFTLVLRTCLNPYSSHNYSIKQIFATLHPLLQKPEVNERDHYKQFYKQRMIQKLQRIGFQQNLNIPDDENLILTQQSKKKLNTGFLKITLKNVKEYKPVFRASRCEFSPALFYAYCSGKSHLLFCIKTSENGVIFAYIACQLALVEDYGIEGRFLCDQNLHSFIYSTKLVDFSRLTIKQKAFKSSPINGPIIGDEDIVLGNNPSSNYSFFPRSFEPIKKKGLIEAGKGKNSPKQGNKFSILNYDVYQVIFKK